MFQPDYRTEIYELSEHSAVGYCERGILKLNRCEFEDAIEDFDLSLRLNPHHARAFNNRGLAREGLRDFQGALKDFTRAIELKYVTASYNRAELRSKLRDRKGAIEDLTECLSHKYLLLQSHACRGWERECSGDIVGAESDFKDALRYRPADSLEYRNLGWILAHQGKHREALVYFDKAISLDPNDPRSFDERADSKRALRDFAGAINDLTQASKIDFGHVDDYIVVGKFESNAYCQPKTFLFDTGAQESALHESALKTVSAGIKLNPNSAYLWAFRAMSKRKLGDDKGAIEDLDRAISLDKRYAWAYVCRGVSKENLHDFKGAMNDYNASIRIHRSNLFPFIKRAHLKAVLVDWKGALRDYRYVFSLGGNAIPSIIRDLFTIRK